MSLLAVNEKSAERRSFDFFSSKYVRELDNVNKNMSPTNPMNRLVVNTTLNLLW